MSVTSGFFNSINGDRKYNAEQMSSIFDGIINDGVFANIGTAFSVQATTGNTVNVGTGRCWFDSTWLLNDATLPIELDDAEVLLDRIDAIVIEINHSESVRAGSIKVVNGTPSSTPTNPTMTHTDYINQYPIAYIMRSANSDAITQANITYTVGSNACPFITGILSVVSIQNIVSQWENEFDTWLDSLSAMLDDNTAANLANQILELKEQFDTLAREKKIYSELEDSTGEDTIDDSFGNPILGTTAMYSDDGTSESIPGTVTGGDPYKVGDTLTTARTDLGAKWLLCNGDVLDRALYPELANLLPYESDITGAWEQSDILTASSGNLFNYDFKYLNGQYIVVGQGTSGGFVAYASNLDGPWTIKYPDSSVSRFYSIFYDDGLYVIVGYNTTPQYYVLYSSSLDGPWTKSSVPVSGTGLYYCGCEYVNGTLSILYYAGNDDHTTYETHYYNVSYCTNLSTGSWSSKRVVDHVTPEDFMYGPVFDSFNRLKFINGYYIAVGQNYEENTTEYGLYPLFAYSSSLTGTWNKNYNLSERGDITDVIYANEQYVFSGQGGAGDSAQAGCIWVLDSLGGSFVKKTIWEDGCVDRIMYGNGKYTIFGYLTESGTRYYAVAESTSLDGPWTKKNICEYPSYNSSFYMEMPCSVSENSNYGVAFRQRTPSPQKILIHYIKPGDITLPSISLSDKTYTYIRAKE